MPKMQTNVQTYVCFRQPFDGTSTMAGVLREAADYLEALGPADLLNVMGGSAFSGLDPPNDLCWELQLYFDDHGYIAQEEAVADTDREEV